MPDEDKLIDDVGAKFESLTDVAFEKLDSPDHFVRMSSSFKEESSNIVLRATMVCATPLSCASEVSAKMSQRQQRTNDLLPLLARVAPLPPPPLPLPPP
jgi:hypothetical protein